MAEHGTTAMYRNGCRCDECKAAKAREKAEYTARKKSGNFKRKKNKPRIAICIPLAFCMSRDFGISHAEIAEVFGCSTTTVTNRLQGAGFSPGKNSNNKRSGQKSHDRALNAIADEVRVLYGGRFEVTICSDFGAPKNKV